MNAEIVVVIPFSEPAPWLDEAVASVKAQTFQSGMEIITVRDTDRRGPGHARNRGIRATSAPWIVALDADDKLKPDALQKMYDARCENGVVYGDLEWIGERSGVAALPEYNAQVLRMMDTPMPVTALHSRSVWEAVNGWDEHLTGLEDVDYWIRLAEIGVCGTHIAAVTLEYRKHSASRTASLQANNRQRWTEAAQMIREKHKSFFGGTMAACATCPSGGAVQNPLSPQPQGTVELKYQGPMQGSFNVVGASGTSYRVEGRGATLFVSPADLPALLDRRTRTGEMEYVRPVRVSAPPPVSSAKLFEPLPAPDPDITELSVREALPLIEATRDPLTLRIWLAQEQANENRVSITRSIKTRARALEVA